MRPLDSPPEAIRAEGERLLMEARTRAPPLMRALANLYPKLVGGVWSGVPHGRATWIKRPSGDSQMPSRRP